MQNLFGQIISFRLKGRDNNRFTLLHKREIHFSKMQFASIKRIRWQLFDALRILQINSHTKINFFLFIFSCVYLQIKIVYVVKTLLRFFLFNWVDTRRILELMYDFRRQGAHKRRSVAIFGECIAIRNRSLCWFWLKIDSYVRICWLNRGIIYFYLFHYSRRIAFETYIDLTNLPEHNY